MGASLDTPAQSRTFVCPLCHRDSTAATTLRCRHRFCESCIGELWSTTPSGPYYCPECKQEYRKLSDAIWETKTPTSTSISRYSSVWKDRSSFRTSSSFLGKRTNAGAPSQQRREQSLGAAHGTDTSDGSSSGAESPPRKRTPSTQGSNTSCSFTPPKSNSFTRGLSDERPSSSMEGTSAQVWSQTDVPEPNHVHDTSDSNAFSNEEVTSHHVKRPGSSPGVRPQTAPQSSRPTTPAMATPPHSRSSPASSKGSPTATSSPRQPPSSDNVNQRARLSDEHIHATSNADVGTSGNRAVVCHYCSQQERRTAVKTCLQCGASMCAEHLRTHLESPVFQGHPLVAAVEDISPWRCQEHQEMNRIYCRPCRVCVCTVCTVIGSHRDHACISIKEAEKELRGQMKEEIQKLQQQEQAVGARKAELLEKKQAFQDVLDEARANVRNQYQAMREALDLEEEQALLCVAKEENGSLGGVEEQLIVLQSTLGTIHKSVGTLTGLADATGALRVQDQAFIMEYSKVASRISKMSDPLENLSAPQQVDYGRMERLRGWTEKRLDAVVISRPHRDPFSLMYGISPVLDQDTAHHKLLLSMANRCVSFSETPQPYPESESRFSSFPQVLATEPLHGGRWYWEVEVMVDEGRWKVGVCEGDIGRKGQKDSSRLGFNALSWCLLSEGKGKVEVLHDKATAAVCADALRRVGLLLDFEEGSLSFFSVAEEGALTLLYSYQHEFTQPLYPALAVSKTQLIICDLFESDRVGECTSG